MAFSVYIKQEDIFPVIFLQDTDEKTTAEIYSFGAMLNAFTVNGTNIIDGYSSTADAKQNITNGFRSCKLSPFVCRIKNGNYVFKNQQYKPGKFFLGKEAIHGLLYDADFAVKDYGITKETAFVTLHYTYSKADEGFPFRYACSVNYKLEKNNSLTITSTIENLSGVEMPLCDGWHPYFSLGNKIDELVLKINSTEMLEFNNLLVPTGSICNYTNFQEPEIFGNTILDNCFILKKNSNAACTLKNKTSGIELNIFADNSYAYLQIFTPEHRNSIAIENLSAAPDAFNNKMGLRTVKPAEKMSFATTYKVSVSL